MSWVLYLATLASALGCGLVAGVFFAFSAFVMPALKRLKPAEGIAAMQAINVAAVTPAFMTVLFGTAAVCGALAVRALLAWDERSAPYHLLRRRGLPRRHDSAYDRLPRAAQRSVGED
jgi:uncharacterized membrane protein